jgi:hypothetical protein
MKVTVAVCMLVLLSASVTGAQHAQVSDDSASRTPLFQLYVATDLKAEFITPSVDPRFVRWFDTPISREAAAIHSETAQRSQWRLVRVPLVLDEASVRRMATRWAAPVYVRDQVRNRRIRLLARHGFDVPVNVGASERTEASTWVRIRALHRK